MDAEALTPTVFEFQPVFGNDMPDVGPLNLVVVTLMYEFKFDCERNLFFLQLSRAVLMLCLFMFCDKQLPFPGSRQEEAGSGQEGTAD